MVVLGGSQCSRAGNSGLARWKNESTWLRQSSVWFGLLMGHDRKHLSMLTQKEKQAVGTAERLRVREKQQTGSPDGFDWLYKSK